MKKSMIGYIAKVTIYIVIIVTRYITSNIVKIGSPIEIMTPTSVFDGSLIFRQMNGINGSMTRPYMNLITQNDITTSIKVNSFNSYTNIILNDSNHFGTMLNFVKLYK